MSDKKKANPKQEWGFYASTPRIVRTQYKQLSHTEKWLYVCLKDLCGDKGTCYRTLKSLSEETDLSTGNLSTGIRNLHEAGLIHAEKKRRSNNPTGKEVWHITIVDIWQANVEHCSKFERFENNVQEMNNNVQEMNNNVQILNEPEPERSNNEPKRSNFVDRRKNNEERTISEERTVSESVLSSTESTPPRDTHTSFENSSREGEQDEPLHSHSNNSGNDHSNQPVPHTGEQDGNLHSHRNNGVNEYSNQSVPHTLRPASDTHGAPSDERKEQEPLAEPTQQQAHSVGTAMSTAPRTPASPLLSPSSGVRGVPLHNRVDSPPADDKSQTNKPVLSKQELALRRKWAKYVSEDITRETVIIALQLRSAWLEAYGAYGDAEWDNQAILWLAQQDNGTWENIQKVVDHWQRVKPGEPVHPEMVKNKWFWANGKPQKQSTEAGGRQLGVSGLPKFT